MYDKTIVTETTVEAKNNHKIYRKVKIWHKQPYSGIIL